MTYTITGHLKENPKPMWHLKLGANERAVECLLVTFACSAI